MSEVEVEVASQRRALTWIVGLLGLALAVAAVLVILSVGGDEEPPTAGPDPVPDGRDEAPTPRETEGTPEAPPMLASDEITLTRDPFASVRPTPVSPPSDGGEDPSNGNGNGNGNGDGRTTLDDLVVFEVDGHDAVIQAGDQVVEVTTGERFAGVFELLETTGGCARVRDVTTSATRLACPVDEIVK